MNNFILGSKVLITTNNWFFGPDGREYRAIYGTVKAVHNDEEAIGIKTNRNATNWYLEIGNTVVAGCQVFYVIACQSPNLGVVGDYEIKDGVPIHFYRPSKIYNADGEA